MSESSTLQVHDFRQPRQLPPTSWRALQRWCQDACLLIAERWNQLGVDVTLEYQSSRTLALNGALAMLSGSGWGIQAALGATSITTVLATSTSHVNSLVRGLLGDSSVNESEVVTLTAIEQSMAELLFQELLMAMGEAWPGAEALECRLRDSVAQPHRTRLFAPRSPVVVTTLHLVTANGRGELHWVMPQEEIEDLLEIECLIPPPAPPTPHPAISRIMRDIPVAVTVELGCTRLSMAELTSLQSGDVLVLDQSCTRLLNARVGNQIKFRGRPGRVGNRRCFEVQVVLEDDRNKPLPQRAE